MSKAQRRAARIIILNRLELFPVALHLFQIRGQRLHIVFRMTENYAFVLWHNDVLYFDPYSFPNNF